MVKKISILIVLLFYVGTLLSQTYHLTVSNGYGSGNYHAGDTIHIWSVAYDTTKVFDKWSGDIQNVQNPYEWHSKLAMPAQNIAVTANFRNIPAYTIHFEEIMGINNLKKVYYFFPANLKGVVYFFHGSGGQASNWINRTEGRSMVDAAIADTLGIIITESEESTLNTDLDSDGKIRWKVFPIDTINGVDYLNLKAITDTLIQRGYFTKNTPRYSVGMSNGGAFSSTVSYIYNYKAGVSYCASSATLLSAVRNNPFAFRMAIDDDHEEVGPEGNYEAFQNDSILGSRGICHDYKLNDIQPLYPERFNRIPGISISTSNAIFNELQSNNQIDNNGYAIYSYDIYNNILASPLSYPTIITLPSNVQLDIFDQIRCANAEHDFFSDYNYETLKFLKDPCGINNAFQEINESKKSLIAFPNPFTSHISLLNSTGNEIYDLYDFMGKKVWSGKQIENQDFSNLTKGIYLMQIQNSEVQSIKLIKQ
jgi:hypothetical protein